MEVKGNLPSKLFILGLALLVISTGCSKPVAPDFINNVPEKNVQGKFSLKALSEDYLSRKLNQLYIAGKDRQMLNEINYARYKQTPLLKSIFRKNPGLYTNIGLMPAISNSISQNSSFALYWNSLPGLQVPMINVSGGSFLMGNISGNNVYTIQTPVHNVTLSNFSIGKYEITLEQYDKYCTMSFLPLVNDNGFGRGNKPVTNVTWNDAIKFCNWLDNLDGLPISYNSSGQFLDESGLVTTDTTKVKGYRLPTEAEWEFAAKGGIGSIGNTGAGYYFSGSDNINDVSWYHGNSGGAPHDVGTKAPNELGIYDMSGNAFEWVQDFYATDYYSGSPVTNPFNSTPAPAHVGRGGAYNSSDPFNGTDGAYAVNSRGRGDPIHTPGLLGFRILRSLI